MGGCYIVNFLLLHLFMVFTIGQKKEGDDKCNLLHDWRGEVCFKDGSGYTRWKCIYNWSSDDDDDDDDIGVWIKDGVFTCKQGHECQCTEGDYGIKDCDCYNSKRFPSFPLTGVLRWTGTNYRDDNWWLYYNNVRTVSIPGEMHKDKHGRFLHKWTDVGKWEYQTKKLPEIMEKFEIIIPKGDGTFRRWSYYSYLQRSQPLAMLRNHLEKNLDISKYTGDRSSKTCMKSIITNEPKLSSFFKEINAGSRTLTFQNSKENGTLTRETWKLANPFEDGKDVWTWKIDYDKNAKLAYPVRYIHRTEDGFVGELRITTLDYNYEPIKGKNITFHLKDYCNKI